MPKVIGIKFKQSGKIYYFNHNLEVKENDKVVVETSRGREIGIVAKPMIDVEENAINAPLIDVIRIATEDDLIKEQELIKKGKDVVAKTRELVQKYKLNMKLVDADFTLDGQKVVINFVCEDRVDFRELVKELASILKLRIELRQIGVRDQAKCVGAIGSCGQECCCKRYLNDFDKVSIKMAKTQSLSLNPTKISGVCGRLMCCLSYENEFYTEALKKLPKVGSEVITKDGKGYVLYNNIFSGVVTVKLIGDDVKVNDYDVNSLTISKFAMGGENVQPENKNKSNTIENDKIIDDKQEFVTELKQEENVNVATNTNHNKNKKPFYKHKNKK